MDGTRVSPRGRDRVVAVVGRNATMTTASTANINGPSSCGPRGRPGLLSLAVGPAFDDELMGGGLEPVEGGLGEQRVGHDDQPVRGSLFESKVLPVRCRSTHRS